MNCHRYCGNCVCLIPEAVQDNGWPHIQHEDQTSKGQSEKSAKSCPLKMIGEVDGDYSGCYYREDQGDPQHQVTEDDVAFQVFILMHSKSVDKLTVVEYPVEKNQEHQNGSAWISTEDVFNGSLQKLPFINREK